MKRVRAAAVSLVLCVFATGAAAFKLQAIGPARDDSPLGVANRQVQGFLSLFTADIHERITRQAFDKAGVKLADDVLTGVRWNDNPPAMRLGPLARGCDARCWTNMLRVDSMAFEALTRRENSIAPLRSHFGDMQFLHAMAAHAGETPHETRAKVLRWSQFAWRVARGEIGPRVNMFELRERAPTMDAEARDWVSGLFASPGKKLWTVRDIFLPRSGDLKLIAFGTLLHLVEDSYSASHVRRDSPRVQANGCPSYDASDAIVEFHTYAGQDTEKHALCDDAPDWLDTPRAGSPTDVVAELVRAYADGRDWPFVNAILEKKVLRLAGAPRAAQPGRCFEMAESAPAAEGAKPPPKALEAACREERP